jgi:hypothetical protein
VRDVKSDYRRPDKYDGKEIMRHYDNLSAWIIASLVATVLLNLLMIFRINSTYGKWE